LWQRPQSRLIDNLQSCSFAVLTQTDIMRPTCKLLLSGVI
jgi:hypothetical protein